MELNSAINQIPLQNSLPFGKFSNNQTQIGNSKTEPSRSIPGDTVSISAEAREKSTSTDDIAKNDVSNNTPVEQNLNNQELTQEELSKLTELQARDKEVRTHEQAHLAAAGGYATGGASFTFQKGPDGQTYAVGGEVGIDLSKENDPSATIQKMQTIKRAALAPAKPSSTDRQVAAQASVKEAQARQELVQEQQEALLDAEKEPSTLQPNSKPSPNISAPSISSLKASLTIYEQMSAM